MQDFTTTNGKANWVYYQVYSFTRGKIVFESLSQIEAEYYARSLITRGERRPDIFEIERF